MGIKPTSVHHIAVCTANMKEQIKFFTDVMGMELVGLYWMHGAKGCWHGFLNVNDNCSLAFVFTPDTPNIESIDGVTHARNVSNSSAPGTVQHIAFNVATMEDLLNLRDRIRSKGVNVVGPIDQGMCQSLYFAGPENLTLEVATSEKAISPELWIDPKAVKAAGISADDLARYTSPAPFEGQGGAIKQPKKDYEKPHLDYLAPFGALICKIPDKWIWKVFSFPTAPNEKKEKKAKWWNIFSSSSN